MSENNIHPTAIIYDGVIIGSGNTIGPYCVIGAPPEWKGKDNVSGHVIIGNNNSLTGFVTVDSSIDPDKPTIIGDNCYLLKRVHLGHGVVLENNVTLSVGATIGGNSYIMEGSNFGLGAICHQFKVIGAYSMIGMGGIVTKQSKILPGEVHVGCPVKLLKSNVVGLSRNNVNEEKFKQLVEKYNIICNQVLKDYQSI